MQEAAFQFGDRRRFSSGTTGTCLTDASTMNAYAQNHACAAQHGDTTSCLILFKLGVLASSSQFGTTMQLEYHVLMHASGNESECWTLRDDHTGRMVSAAWQHASQALTDTYCSLMNSLMDSKRTRNFAAAS